MIMINDSMAEKNVVISRFRENTLGRGLIGEIKAKLAGANVWGQDRIIQGDHLLAYKHAAEGGSFRQEFRENGIPSILREGTPELVTILTSEFGEKWDWDVETPEGVLKQAWYISEALNRREVHGYMVNKELRHYWEQPRFNPDSHERIFLPESKEKRNQLVERAQLYNEARVDVKARMASMIKEIADAKGYKDDSDQYLSLRERLNKLWEVDETQRAKNCVYLGSDEGNVLNMYDVDNKIRNGESKELIVISQWLTDSSGISNKDSLLHQVGIVSHPEKGYMLDQQKLDSPAHLMMRSRMGQKQHLATASECWKLIPPESEKNADITLMNALGLESLVKMEVMAREIMIGEIYIHRGLELIEEGEKKTNDRIKNVFKDSFAVAEKGDSRIMFAFFVNSMREVNELYYSLAATLTNLLRWKTHTARDVIRRGGEKMAKWIDRVAMLGAVSIDGIFARAINRANRNFVQTDTYKKSGRVTPGLNPVDSSEETYE